MSLVKTIENVELERANGKNLMGAMMDRLDSLTAEAEALHSHTLSLVQQLDKLCGDLKRAKIATAQELQERDQALANIIGDE